MQVYKIDAEGDSVYVEGINEDYAFETLCAKFGAIPRNLLNITKVDKAPEGEEVLGRE